MNEKLGIVKKVGNAVATILLGNTRETIIRTDEKVQTISRTLDQMGPDLKEIREKFSGLETKVNTLWADKYATAHSPRRLNERGKEILIKSGIKELVETNRSRLLEMVRAKNPTNAYDAEQAIMTVMADFPKQFPDTVVHLKDGAFRSGVTIDTLLYVGGLHLRDEIFPDLGFTLEQIDTARKP